MAQENTTLNDTRIKKSITTLANANELVAQLVAEVVGNDVSDSLNGTRITTDSIKGMAQARFYNKLNTAQR